jgi:uracil-DNA glycosylase family 4
MKCTACRLSETCPKVLQMGHGKKKARVMVIQENPYEHENKKGKYFSGKAGKLLQSAFEEVGIDADDVYYTAVVKCSTPEDRLPLKDEVKACEDYLWAEIDAVEPEIIIPTGNMSLWALTGRTAITKQRGRLIEKDGYKFFPMIHPNMVLKQPKYMEFFSKDIINLHSILEGVLPADILAYEQERLYCEDYDTAINELKRLMALPDGHLVTVDLETVKSNPYLDKTVMSKTKRAMFPESEIVKISAIGFSDRAGYGNAIPLYHRETPFTGNQIGTIVKFIRFLIEDSKLEFVAHNSKFEMKWLLQQLDIYLADLKWDTMLMHYLAVTEEKGTHDLKQLAWLETDMGGYDDELDPYLPKGDDEGNYDMIPWDTLKVYLAADVDVTYRLLDKYKPLIEEDKEKKWLWDNLMVPGLYALMDIEHTGAKVDGDLLGIYRGRYEEEIDRIEAKLREYPEIVSLERERHELWLERVAIGGIKKANRTEEQQTKFEKNKKYDPKKGGDKLNFGSSTQLQVLFFEIMGLETVVLTDKGHPSTNDDSLKYMRNQHPMIALLMEYRKVAHLYSNFIDKMSMHVDARGLIHGNYNLHGTVTGRLSSNEPNMQQLPRKVNDPFLFQYWNEIKALFVSRFGDDGVIIQFDYSQLELRILAVMTGDPELIRLYRSGADLHKEVASGAFGVPVSEVTKDQRTASKKIQFGIVYQESAKGLSEDLRAEGINMSVEECQSFIDSYFKRFPVVERWIKRIKKFAKKNKHVRTMTNRIRHLDAIDSTDRSVANEAERQAVNAPIQSTGSDCTLMALIIINDWLQNSDLKSRIVITVHDSIVFDCPKDEVVEVSEKVKHVMENLAEYNEFYKFLGDVPILSEMEIGYNYGHSFECSIEDIKEQGVDGFLQKELADKHTKEQEKYAKAEKEGTPIPKHVTGYWENIA